MTATANFRSFPLFDLLSPDGRFSQRSERSAQGARAAQSSRVAHLFLRPSLVTQAHKRASAHANECTRLLILSLFQSLSQIAHSNVRSHKLKSYFERPERMKGGPTSIKKCEHARRILKSSFGSSASTGMRIYLHLLICLASSREHPDEESSLESCGLSDLVLHKVSFLG